MASREISNKAKNNLMRAMADEIFRLEEETDEMREQKQLNFDERLQRELLIEQMRKDATRVVKMLGFTGFPGICVDGQPINR